MLLYNHHESISHRISYNFSNIFYTQIQQSLVIFHLVLLSSNFSSKKGNRLRLNFLSSVKINFHFDEHQHFKKLSCDYNFPISIAIDVHLIKTMNSTYQEEVLCNLRSSVRMNYKVIFTKSLL